ncbi:MAG: hypothetical protein AAB778_00430 [Patescibacteria group bacterium]
MNKLAYKLVASAMSAGLVLGTFATSVFASGVSVTGNGANSDNTVVITNTKDCTVMQGNATLVLASVKASSNTGGNTANANTNGDVTVDTGTATSTASMIVTGGDNTVTNSCCCTTVAPTTDTTVSGNGDKSTNTVVTTNANSSTLAQGGITGVAARVKAKAKTGKNRANRNTGPGTVEVLTGNSVSASALNVTGGSNTVN